MPTTIQATDGNEESDDFIPIRSVELGVLKTVDDEPPQVVLRFTPSDGSPTVTFSLDREVAENVSMLMAKLVSEISTDPKPVN